MYRWPIAAQSSLAYSMQHSGRPCKTPATRDKTMFNEDTGEIEGTDAAPYLHRA